MGRPRTVSDEDILEATARVVARLGPIRFTLADVAAEVGLTAAGILRRFDTKRALLLALVEAGVRDVPARFAVARRDHASPTGALVAALLDWAATFRSRAEAAHSLAFLQLDVTDPDFNRLARGYFDAVREETRIILDAAVDAGEIRTSDSAALARAVEVAYNGSLIVWAISGDGTAADAVRRDVEALLAPLRRPRRATKGG